MTEPVQNSSAANEVLEFLNSIEGAGYGGMASFEIARQHVREMVVHGDAQPALETAPLRLCGYCKSWNSKPCGEGCCWSPTDPTIEKVRADDLKAKQKHNRKHPLPVTFER